jgi:hypothetical protein
MLSKADRKAGLLRVTMLTLTVSLPEYEQPLHVCYRLFPILRPTEFRATIRCFVTEVK